MNKLEYLKDFQDILTDYHVSEAGKKVITNTTLVLCSGATASGRNTIIRELLKDPKYYFIISDTTRKPRVNDGVPEETGVTYWFRTEKQMLADLKQGKMLEAEIIHQQQVSGMSVREIAKAKENHQIAITDADSGGVKIVMSEKPDTICLFFLPPSFKEWQQRIRKRGEMSEAERVRRFKTAVQELKTALKHDYYKFVINGTIPETVKVVDCMITKPETIDAAEQTRARELAQDILEKTEQMLAKIT